MTPPLFNLGFAAVTVVSGLLAWACWATATAIERDHESSADGNGWGAAAVLFGAVCLVTIVVAYGIAITTGDFT